MLCEKGKKVLEIVASEDDELKFTYRSYQCLIKRYLPNEFGHLNGYVQIPKHHDLHNVRYLEMDFDVHGGLVFGGMLDDEDGYWIGFDTAHHTDITPAKLSQGDCIYFKTYKDMRYVREEIEYLVDQLIEY